MKKNKKRLPRYGRAANPPNMRLTKRDRHILEAIHAYDGMLSFSQIRRLFFSGKSQAEERLKLLYQNKYLNRPGRDQRLRLPDMIYWLDRRGAELVASWSGMNLSEMGWRREPRWFQVEHDLAVNDFRLDLQEAIQPKSVHHIWKAGCRKVSSGLIPIQSTYTYNDRKIDRKIRPDGFFMLHTGQNRIRYLLEIDRSTEDNPRFLREKILPGLAYLHSPVYEQRFGHRSGRWLVVTTSDHRLENMLHQARRAKARGLFYFTTYDQVRVDTILFSPIWRRVDREDAVPLLFVD